LKNSQLFDIRMGAVWAPELGNYMKAKFKSFIRAACRSLGMVCAVAVVLHFGMLASSAQTGIYLYTGSMTTITLNPGTYDITAYGASGDIWSGGLGAEMGAQFTFAAGVNLTILVGGGGGTAIASGGGGGGGGSFVVSGNTPLVVAGGGGGSYYGAGGSGLTGTSGGQGLGLGYGGGGLGGGGLSGGDYSGGGGGGFYSGGSNAGYFGGSGGSSFLDGGAGGSQHPGQNGGGGGYGGGGGSGGGGGGGGGGYSGGGGGYDGGGGGGGSIIDSSAITVLAEVSGVASPDGSRNGEIIITAVPVPEPSALGLLAIAAAALLVHRR
jgi:hypothetical protein